MIQLVTDRPVARDSTRWRITDPDLLIVIAERIRADTLNIGRSIDDFSLILRDLRMGGTWKRTSRGRLPLAQTLLCKHLIPRHETSVSVLDVGASDGLATLDLMAGLRQNFGDAVRVTLTDLNIWLLRFRRGFVLEYRARNGEAIMVKIGRLGLRLGRPRHSQPQTPDPLAALYLRCGRFRRAMRLDRRISLIHPLVHNVPSIQVLERDCLVRDNSLVGTFDAIRASNVLNSGYFVSLQMKAALENFHAYLNDCGCLVISRNEDGANREIENGSVWRKNALGFSRLTDFGAGSEIAQIVDRWRAP